MIGKLLKAINPANWGSSKPKKKTIKLEVVAQKMEEFQKQKEVLDHRIEDLEDKSTHMQDALVQTLDLTATNQKRLNSIEHSMERLLELTQKMINPGGVGDGQKADSKKELSEPEPSANQQ